MINGSPLLIVFLKVPKPGFVKTRLAESLGKEEACQIYQGLVEGLLERIRSFASVELRITPDEGVLECDQWCQTGWSIVPQGEGDLGTRMNRAFEEAFSRGRDRVLAIGSDCPYVGIDQIIDGLDRLEEDSVVLGPANDGGYWMIGMRNHLPALFEGIDWSTERVLEQTLGAVEAMDLSVSLLEPLEDIDDLDAWNRYIKKKSKK